MAKYEELEYVLLKAAKPSVFFEVQRQNEVLGKDYPELYALIDVPQNPEWHQEGDVWNHTMLVLDNAAFYRERTSNPFAFMLSALCHDLGKAVCTKEINGKIHAYQHEEYGVPITRTFLERLGVSEEDSIYVENMVELHMKPHHASTNKSAIKKTNKMFDEAICPRDLIYLALSDSAGCLPAKHLNEEQRFLLDRLAIFNNAMKASYVTAEDIVNMGISFDTDKFYHVMEFAHKLRLAMVEKDNALRQVKSYAGIQNKAKDSEYDRDH